MAGGAEGQARQALLLLLLQQQVGGGKERLHVGEHVRVFDSVSFAVRTCMCTFELAYLYVYICVCMCLCSDAGVHASPKCVDVCMCWQHAQALRRLRAV